MYLWNQKRHIPKETDMRDRKKGKTTWNACGKYALILKKLWTEIVTRPEKKNIKYIELCTFVKLKKLDQNPTAPVAG